LVFCAEYADNGVGFYRVLNTAGYGRNTPVRFISSARVILTDL
jgi:hypothetical protein